ncbi:MAG: pseudouridine synthase [Bacteroidetes bacterium]|nr:pseudouridine synthase [Bacteroidota bacterium]
MVFKKPRNSRDDRSSGAPKRNADSYRGKGSSQGRKPSDSRYAKSSSPEQGDKPRRNFRSNDEQGDRPARKPAASRYPKPASFGQGDKPKRNFRGDDSDVNDKKPFSPRRKPYSGRPEADDRPKRNYGGESSGERRSYGSGKTESYGRRSAGDDRPKRNYGGESSGEKRGYGARKSAPYGSRPSASDRPKRNADRSDNYRDRGGERPFNPRFKEERGDKPFRKSATSDFERPSVKEEFAPEPREKVMRGRKKAADKEDAGLIRLNRYISNAGICSRRKADELITAGVISVNGEVVSELGYKVDPAKDVIRYNGETLKREKMVYVLLNKPKDYITTTDDPQERRTVMQLVEKASRERIYPVGRLDRNTTGLLLLTNDGDLADKLSHPKNNITKLYQVELDKSLTQGDLNKIAFGVELEDGLIKPDMISYVAGGTKRDIGIQIHSGKNRIVRRIFEHLGYEVVKLDRSVYAGLTKKDLPRGRWRYLDEREIIQLKHLV